MLLEVEMRVSLSAVLIAAVAGTLSCQTVSGPGAVAIQFRGGVAEGAVATTSVMEDPLRSIRIVGSYADGGCGAIGATASRTGNAIAFVVGPGTGECDLIRLIYEYDATLVGLEPGLYRVRVFHRPSAGPRELAIESTVTVH